MTSPPPSSPPERPLAQTAGTLALERFLKEYYTGSHRRIAASWKQEQLDEFPPAAKYRGDVELANRCVQTVARMVAEHRRGHWAEVLAIYDSWRDHFDYCHDYQTAFKVYVEHAHRQLSLEKFKPRLQRALEQNDDAELEKVLSEASILTHSPILEFFEQERVLTAAERARAVLALERLAVIREIQAYLERKDTHAQALALYDEKLQELQLTESQALTALDRIALYEARRAQTRQAFRDAVLSGDDARMLAAANAALAAGWTLSEATMEVLRQASERQAARERLLHAGSERDLVIAYDAALLAEDRKLEPEKRETVEAVQRLYKPLLALKRAVKKNDVRTIAAYVADSAQLQELTPHLDAAEKLVVTRVQAAAELHAKLRPLLAAAPHSEETLQQIAALCHVSPGNSTPSSRSTSETLRTCQVLMTPFEQDQLHKALLAFRLVDELRQLDHPRPSPLVKRAIAQTYQKALAEGIILPMTLNWSKIRMAVDFEERWSALMRALDANDEQAIFAAWNPAQLYEALDLLSDKQKQTILTAVQNVSRRERLANALASDDEQRIAYARRELRDVTDISKS